MGHLELAYLQNEKACRYMCGNIAEREVEREAARLVFCVQGSRI